MAIETIFAIACILIGIGALFARNQFGIGLKPHLDDAGWNLPEEDLNIFGVILGIVSILFGLLMLYFT